MGKFKMTPKALRRMEPVLAKDEKGDLYLIGYRRKATSHKPKELVRLATPRLMATKEAQERPDKLPDTLPEASRLGGADPKELMAASKETVPDVASQPEPAPIDGQ